MEILLSNASDKPIYEQITAQIKRQIAFGELREGEALPSIRALARDLGISVITTKRAYQELERDGFIETVTGKGCFVARRNNALWREEALRQAEEHMRHAAECVRTGGIGYEEYIELAQEIWEEEP